MDNINASVYKKMALVMGEIGRIPKAGKNTKFDYDFVTAEDIKDVVRRAMSKHNLALLMNLTDYEIETIKTSGGGTGTKVRGSISYTLACGDTGESITSIMPMEAIDYQDKVFSKLYTIGLKYFLIDTFCISTGDETDPDGETNAPTIAEVTGSKKNTKQVSATAPKSNGDKSDPWPAKSGPVYEFCEAVKTATLPLPQECQYTSQFHLEKVVGGFLSWLNDPEKRASQLSVAVDHARAKTGADDGQTAYGNDGNN